MRASWVVATAVLAALCSRPDPEAEPGAPGSAPAPAASVHVRLVLAPSAVVPEAAEPLPAVAATSPVKLAAPLPSPPVPVAASAASPPPPSVPAALSAAPAPAAPPRRGPVASGEGYETWLETTGGYVAGQSGVAVVVLQAKPPFKCNAEYPHKLALGPPPVGVGFPNPIVKGMKVDGKTGTLSVPFVAERAGSANLAGTLSFSVCTPERCLMEKARVSVPLEIR